MGLIRDIQKNLAEDLSAMNDMIASYLVAREELVALVGKYLIDGGGKRIRPLLTILSSKMFKYSGENHIRLAAAVEFIHTATLLHDDVVDESAVRRFKPTANVIWGSKSSILVGDFLFSQSFKLMVETRSISAMQSLSKASAIIAEGEVAQLVKLKERRLITIEEYQGVIAAKTAELFAAACEVGAIIADQPLAHCKILWNFGMVLGNIFQIIDDLLDYFGSEKEIGKNIADDFLEGKVTLPLILLYDSLAPEEQAKLLTMIENDNRSWDDFLLIKKLLDQYSIKEQVMVYLESLKIEAHSWLKQISITNRYKDYLADLVEFTVNRSF
ncbi:Octaprenyl-diphosphate synthase [Candidatus Trichorickettsia mobilis]|uniref:Octaprenyl-diphosphate synthase n=1 Tax=Candidatus Trichorickettsia mobilis TaxID=1346319 RepID=A0ABZ0UR18_9RICK|nr:polyprenyl synthetase family protein [Candidatus Trichorickettsia mobilis]WPY00261.1 Octaprenyl-diphosphate synthase [Candidatus Trichorickettsia mobilis]